MARGKQQINLTTITLAKASDFLKQAQVREVISCKNIPGFHLMKLATGGVWRYRYSDNTGKRRVATVGKYSHIKPEAAAEIVHDWIINGIDPLADKTDRRQKAQKAVTDTERRTLRYYLENYYKPHMERSWKYENAKANYGRLVKHFAKLLDRDMATFDKADIDEWQREIEGKGRTYTTVKRTYGALKTLLRHAVQNGAIDVDPLAKHKLLEPKLSDQEREKSDPKQSERRMLTHDEIAAIHNGLDLFADEIREQRRSSRKHGKAYLPDLDLQNYPHWFIPFCQLALHTGLRPGDLYTLKWEELNLTFGRLTKTCEKTAHAARRQRKPTVVDLKLNDTIKAVMAGWHKDKGKPKGGLVFPSPVTGLTMDGKAHRKPWKRVKELGGLPDTLNFYSLRHHFISALLANGVSVFVVAKLVGHKGPEMILEHYGHLCPDQAAEALDIVARSVTATNSHKADESGAEGTRIPKAPNHKMN
ncbi:tyrosine-type recombinase/integrase [Porticoccus sp.]